MSVTGVLLYAIAVASIYQAVFIACATFVVTNIEVLALHLKKYLSLAYAS